MRQRVSSEEDRGIVVDVHHVHDFLGLDGFHLRLVEHAVNVDKDVQAAELADHRIHDLLADAQVGEVFGQGQNLLSAGRLTFLS